MKKTLSISLIAILLLALFFTQAFAVSSADPGVKPKQTPKPGETETVEAPEAQEVEQDQQESQGNKPDKAEKKAGKKYNFKGEVVSFDGGTLVLTPKKGGSNVTVTVDGNTVIQFSGPKDGASEIKPGQGVMVQAVKTDGDAYLAVRVHVMPGKPQHVHRVGEVTAYEAGKSITVQDKKGSTTFQIATDVKILPAERVNMLKVGARVTIISPNDPSATTPVARGIVVHPEKGQGDD